MQELYRIFSVSCLVSLCVWSLLPLDAATAYPTPVPVNHAEIPAPPDMISLDRNPETVYHSLRETGTREATLEAKRDSLERFSIGTTGLNIGPIRHGASFRPEQSDVQIGIYNRHRFGSSLWGEARLSIGFLTGPAQRSRLVPFEYRINVPFRRAKGANDTILPYMYVGGGLLYHKPVEEFPPEDPRTGDLDGTLPPSGFFDFKSGITPVLPAGLGVDLPLDATTNLNLQIGYHRTFDRFTLRGAEFRDHFFGLSIGLNFRREPAKPPSPPPAVPLLPLDFMDMISPFPAEDIPEEQPVIPMFPVSVDTLRENECLFTIQIGTFSSIRDAIRVMGSTEEVMNDRLDIYYNRKNQTYAIRTGQIYKLPEAVEAAERLRRESGRGETAVVNQCYANDHPDLLPVPLEYQVQLASFRQRSNAQHYAEQIRSRYGIRTYILETDDPHFYRVRTGHYPAGDEAFRFLEMIRSLGLEEDIYLARSPETSLNNLEFEYRLQAGTFSTLDEAVSHAERLHNRFGYRSRIIVVEEGVHNLMLDTEVSSLNEILVVKREFESEENDYRPVIHVLEHPSQID